MKKVKQKARKSNTTHVFILIGILLVIIVFLFFVLQSGRKDYSQKQAQSEPSPTPSLKTYHSDFLGLTFEYPPEYEVEEEFTNAVYLKHKNGTVEIHRLFSNLTNIEDYLIGYDSHRTIEILDKQNLKIDGYNAVNRLEKFSGGPINEAKAYFIFIQNVAIYVFSTDDENLYDDLDQIARSFRYDP